MKKEIKQGDVFKFRWSPKKEQGWDIRYHCFEGYIIAEKMEDKMVLYDTYWGLKEKSTSHRFNLELIKEEVKNGGSFEFYFNLSDYEKISEHESHYLDPSDVVYISEQHACSPSCVFYYKKKGAKRSQAKMLEEIDEKIREEKHKVEWAVRTLEQLVERKTKIEAGDLEQYI